MDINSPDRERPAKFCELYEPWQMLSAAIIRCACDDYKRFSGQGRVAVERFIRSNYFSNISMIDPEWLITNLKESFRPNVVVATSRVYWNK